MPTWEEELKELTAEFFARLEARLAQLLARVERPEELRDPARFEWVQRELHSLAGAGATFGVAGVTAAARGGEAVCQALADGRLDPAAASDRLLAVVAAIRAAGCSAETAAPPFPLAESGLRSPPPDVLIVDGDPAVQARLSRLLSLEGLTVAGASSLQEARAMLEPGLPGGLIVDVRLPDGTGYELVEDLRARPGGDLPAVVMFNLAAAFLDQTDAIHAGADACFERPVEWEALTRKLHQLLERATADVPRILVVEDDVPTAAYARSILEAAGYDVKVCDAPREFDEALAAFRPDLILMDIVLPDVSGYDLTRYVRQDDQYVALPIIFLTSETDNGARIQTVKAGGDDYLLKPVNPSLLVANVAARLERAGLLKTLLNRDGLTRLLTHTSFMEHAQALVAQKARQPAAPACLVMLDIDHFKSTNDTYGHQAGDRVLVSLATLLRRHLRRSDVIGRYGGEEFAILLDGLTEEEASRLMDRLLNEFGAVEHRAPSGASFCTTFSAGVSGLEAPGMSLERWIQAADSALYGAKRAGRNRVMSRLAWRATLHPGLSA
jgi:diguanylate cyclase (GGDEF)-like protein